MAEPVRSFDPERPLVLDPDPVAQWLDWEEQANLVGFRTSTRPIAIEVALVPRAAVEVHILPGAPGAIVDHFLRPDGVAFPRHPLNHDGSVAWFHAPTVERWTGRFTSSRTLALPVTGRAAPLTSLKLATDHPHPDFHQPEKAKLREEALGAVEWVRTLARIDRLLEPLAGVVLVTEVLVVLAVGQESGFLVRDLRCFQDGHYYLPALSLPWVGRQIARANGEPFEGFWGRCYAQAVGRSKAHLFARYGLWFETPNPQNVLVQLDRSLRPTGTLVFRDVGDAECATDSATAQGRPWTCVRGELQPETRNSFWAFGEAGDHSVDDATLATWYALHDDAYFEELGRWFPALAPGAATPAEARLAHWNEALRGPNARASFAAAFAQHRARHG